MIIELPVGKSRYKITCDESEKERLFHLAEQLNKRVNKLALQLKNADEKTLLVISALMIQEELERQGGDKSDEENAEDARDETNKINDEELYQAIGENMENIAEYIEKLTAKIQNY